LDLWGVVGGTAVAVVAGSAALLVWFHRDHGLASQAYWSALGKPAVLCGIAAAPVAALQLAVGVPGDRVGALAMLAAGVALFAPVYWVLAGRAAILPDRLSLRARRRSVSHA
jgi:hypothetical protein